jgi:hypothetical protein
MVVHVHALARCEISVSIVIYVGVLRYYTFKFIEPFMLYTTFACRLSIHI